MKDGVNLSKHNGLYSSILPGKKEISEKKDKQCTEFTVWCKFSKSLLNTPQQFYLKMKLFFSWPNSLATCLIPVCVDSHSSFYHDDG